MKFYIGSSLKNSQLVRRYGKTLENQGWEWAYDWTKQVGGSITMEDLARFGQLERQGVVDSDVVIVLLPAGRGAHMELGMALALEKKVFLCAASQEDFSLESTVSFYQLPELVQLSGSVDDNIEAILKAAQG